MATTDRSIAPRSTVATFDGSILDDAPLMVEKPQIPATTTQMRLPIADPIPDDWGLVAGRVQIITCADGV